MDTNQIMKRKRNMDALDAVALLGGLVFFAPVSLLVRTAAGVSLRQFFLLQSLVSVTILLTELPGGRLTDRIGYRKTLIVYQFAMLLARLLLLAAFALRSPALFALEAVVEGAATSLSSGTQSAYIYTAYPDGAYAAKAAHVANFGTAGFLISTLAYAGLYAAFGLRGLLIATAAASALAVPVSMRIPEEPRAQKTDAPHPALRSALPKLLRSRRLPALLALLGLLSLARLLVNFFYAEKLRQCGLSETWMTALILGYSALELLAEPLLLHTPRARQGRRMALFFALGGAALLLLGLGREPLSALLAMLLLPLLLDVPDYLLGERQNALIDEAGQEQNRAGLLSVFNMGLNAAEVFFLLGSSVIAGAGLTLCFVCLGALFAAAGGFLLLRREVD